MISKKNLIAIILTVPFFCLASCKGETDNFKGKVIEAINAQLKLYPESRLPDIYKNFYQDMFGPGHMIPDTTAAGNYLRSELASYTECTGPYLDPTGWNSNFYRVNLSVLKEGIIPYDAFFEAFIESVNGIVPPAPDDWRALWNDVLAVIDEMQLNIPDYQNDKAALEKFLAEGNFTIHHSEAFNIRYQPHYRIIERSIFEAKLKQYIGDKLAY